MLDYQRIVDDVRAAMQASGPQAVDQLRLTVADYAVACDEANQRLRRCGALLNQGLRSEALQLAKLEPDLLDLVTTLDFPEQPLLAEMAREHGIVPPAPLHIEIAAQLNDAYAQQQPLETLLKQHRLMALAGSPLPWRIRTLRRIAQLDRQNPVWQQDLEMYESERLKQIHRQALQAIKQQDAAILEALNQELMEGTWTTLPTDGLIRQVADGYRTVRSRVAREELSELVSELDDCLTRRDAEAACALRQRWLAAAEACDLAPEEPLAERASPFLRWAGEVEQARQQQAAFTAALEKLEQGIEVGASLDELSDRRQAAEAFGWPLPAELLTRYDEHVRRLRATARRRRTAKLTAVAAGLVIVVAGATWGISAYRHHALVAYEAAQLTALLEPDQLPAGRRYWEELKARLPHVAASPTLAEVAKRLDAEERREQDRQKRFQDALQRQDAGAARTAARTAAERASLARLEQQLADATLQSQRQADEQFRQVMESLAQRADTAEVQLTAKPGIALDEAFELKKQLRQLRSEGPRPSSSLQAEAEKLAQRLDALEARANRSLKQGELLGRITAAVGDAAEFATALSRYIEQLPDDPRSARLQRCLEDSHLWESMERADKLLARWPTTAQATAASSEVTELADELRSLLAHSEDVPLAAQLRRRLEHCEAITARGSAQESPLVGKLVRLFRDRLIADLYMVQLTDGTRYYLLEAGKPAGNFLSVRYYAGFDLSEKTRLVPVAEIETQGPAPQSELAQAVLPRLTKWERQSWEECFSEVLKAVNEQGDLDPILKLVLLKQTLEVAVQGSVCFREAFAPHLAHLRATAAPLIPWMDPTSEAANNERAKARTHLRDLPSLQEAAAVAQENWKAERQAALRYRWIGWLLQQPDESWRVELKPGPPKAGTLYVAWRPQAGAMARLEAIGRVDDGAVKLSTSASTLLVEGRPVYLLDSEQPMRAEDQGDGE